MWLSSIFHRWSWLIIGVRPKTWVAFLSPFLISVTFIATQLKDVNINGWVLLSILISGLSIQIATNLFNDVLDYQKGVDTADRLGPLRVTQQGLANPHSVFRWAVGFLILAFCFGMYLVYKGGWPVLGVGLLSMLLAYFYTGGPWPISRLGLGEIFVILFFGIIPGLFIGFLLTERWYEELGGLGFLTGLWSAALILINNLRDYESDRRAARKTLPIRFGVTFGKKLFSGLVLLPSLLMSAWVGSKKGAWLVLPPLLVIPSVIQLIGRLFRAEPSRFYNQLLTDLVKIHWRWTWLVVITLYLCGIFNINLID
ncbi:MAG: 1,4-dihydroxy-2-naphthoate octaprenyltransferase [Bdellovibrionaceae bacterium]|nr:1,4-dihydroxy-2-naphthoate octaprenyltransferase [Pseudobdellovibrionaceae bacterium]MDW8191088.1 1,4-dihydroxy-2-naphthoate octaprenyltransferase [Pseudobdellovibrionaceae bacterium]